MENALILGLGNPGLTYRHTRHNVGFDTVDILAERLGIRLSRQRGKALVGEGMAGGSRVVLCQPQTMMNLSGESAVALMQWYRTPPERMLVICDDVDLPVGRLRLRRSGGAGTHNGLRNIVLLTGQTAFPRLRVGIGPQPRDWDLAHWVLSRPLTPEEQALLDDSLRRAAEAAACWLTEGADRAMNQYNGTAN